MNSVLATRAFHQRVAVVSSRGDHIRYVHSALATALVSGGAAQQPDPQAGRVRSITLACPSVLRRIGEPTNSPLGGVRFTRWTRLDQSAVRVIEHHPRCTYD